MKTRGDRLHKAPVAAIRVPCSAAVHLSLPRWAYVPGQIVAVVVVQGQLGEDRHCRPKMKQNAHYNHDKATRSMYTADRPGQSRGWRARTVL
jgi:hypothetical protein